MTGTGVNAAGNSYRTYSDGSYAYNNAASARGGASGGTYYGTAGGAGFYHGPAGSGYSSYTRSDGSGWTDAGSGRVPR